jgi:hypothetical protein
MKDWRCATGWHKWPTRWTKRERISLLVNGEYVPQLPEHVRICRRCKLRQVRT